MTRTKRIYNKRPLLGGPGLKGWIVSNRGVPEIMDLANDYVFRPHGYYCMGNCPSCKRRDKRDQKRKTAKKAEIEGILRGLEDFIEGRCTHFKNDEDLEEYLMELPESMRTNLEASLKRNKEAFDCLKSL